MKHYFLFPGKTKEKFLSDGIKFYLKRLRPMTDATELILKGAALSPAGGPSEELKAKVREGQTILEQCSPAAHVIVLDVSGKSMSSPSLAQYLNKLQLNGIKTVNWVVGGPWGLDDALVKRSDLRLSFGPMTFPHDLARLMLLEQVYRAYAILANSPYHK